MPVVRHGGQNAINVFAVKKFVIVACCEKVGVAGYLGSTMLQRFPSVPNVSRAGAAGRNMAPVLVAI
jgi:hypothetical protein